MSGPGASIEWTGRYLRVMRNGRWEYAERVGANGAVAIVALTPAKEIVLVEQHRVPLDRRVVELPAGLSGDEPGHSEEAMEAAARRELREETGFEARDWRLLTSGPPSAGMATEMVTFFLATGLSRVHAGGGAGQESIEVHLVPIAAIEEWLAERQRGGVLIDPKIFAGLYFARGADV